MRVMSQKGGVTTKRRWLITDKKGMYNNSQPLIRKDQRLTSF